jgi:hypothetical protein
MVDRWLDSSYIIKGLEQIIGRIDITAIKISLSSHPCEPSSGKLSYLHFVPDWYKQTLTKCHQVVDDDRPVQLVELPVMQQSNNGGGHSMWYP